MNKYLTFTNKDGYLTQRAMWREDYALLSTAIRAVKVVMKDKQRKGGYAGSEQSKLRGYRVEARDMMVVRQDQKRRAETQYQANKEAAQVELQTT